MKLRVVPGVAMMVLCVALTISCVPLYRPAREPLDQNWNEWMLAGHYGLWEQGKEVPWGVRREDAVHSSPIMARTTRYGIRVRGDAGPFANADWSHLGGMVGRAEADNHAIELFGKESALIHYPGGVSQYGRDYSYEFFLLVRPRPEGRATLTRTWSFAPEQLALWIDPRSEELLRRMNVSDAQRERLRAQQMRHKVEGHLRYDDSTKTATVTITGLKQPFEERIGLSEFLK